MKIFATKCVSDSSTKALLKKSLFCLCISKTKMQTQIININGKLKSEEMRKPQKAFLKSQSSNQLPSKKQTSKNFLHSKDCKKPQFLKPKIQGFLCFKKRKTDKKFNYQQQVDASKLFSSYFIFYVFKDQIIVSDFFLIINLLIFIYYIKMINV